MEVWEAACENWTESETKIRRLARPIIGDKVNGDEINNDGPMDVVSIVEELVGEIAFLQNTVYALRREASEKA